MEKVTFTLRPDEEYIVLLQLLKIQQIAQSGGHAKMMVEDGLVQVNGKKEYRKRKKLRPGDVVEIDGAQVTIGN